MDQSNETIKKRMPRNIRKKYVLWKKKERKKKKMQLKLFIIRELRILSSLKQIH